MTDLQRHTLPAPPGLLTDITTLYDIGAGIRPVLWYPDRVRHVCVEPYEPYADVLVEAGYAVERFTALAFLQAQKKRSIDTLCMLDVIEHIEKDEGLLVIAELRRVARWQIIIYTPYGFREQDHDPWGFGGHDWQTHRSGWLPKEFPGWKTHLFQPHPEKPVEGFYALWTHS